PRAGGIGALHARRVRAAALLHDSDHARHARGGRPAARDRHPVARPQGPLSAAPAHRTVDVSDLALRLDHPRPGLRPAVPADLVVVNATRRGAKASAERMAAVARLKASRYVTFNTGPPNQYSRYFICIARHLDSSVAHEAAMVAGSSPERTRASITF